MAASSRDEHRDGNDRADEKRPPATIHDLEGARSERWLTEVEEEARRKYGAELGPPDRAPPEVADVRVERLAAVDHEGDRAEDRRVPRFVEVFRP